MAIRSRISLAARRARVSSASSACSRIRPLRPLAQMRWQSTASTEDSEGIAKGTTGTSKTIKFTSETYPEIKRDSRFAQISEENVKFFKDLLGKESAVIDGVTKDATDDIEPFNGDWMRKYRGHTSLVFETWVYGGIVPQGGNTGLVGGSVPVFDEIVINMSRMNQIRSFDEVSGTLVVDAGVVLETADNYLAERKHIFPLDLGAKGSCHIGGNVATNAGGLRLLRYGSLHGNVLGIEAVLPDGTIVDDLSKLRKNNTEAFKEAKGQLSEILSAFELMDSYSQDLVQRVTKNKRPLEGEYPFYCLIETSGSNSEHDQEKLNNFLEHVMEKEIVSDGTLAENATQIKDLWGWREGIPECLGHWGGLVDDVREKITEAGLIGDTSDHPVVGVVGYGHMGDSNLHLNVATRSYDKRVEKVLEPFVYEWIAKRNGSISAEHGLGLAKKNYIGYSRSETMIGLMKQIKNLYDPNGIMNPYKYI
ncbi:hypothetical protein EYC84_011520 [Monilinia fructicola]|uniref:FAD-binding PCMH-type domain-containing protein n=1 Tax=Monilinia fructicola TaxID=38448 RepID=A0A5M9J726_MONFR|nr:hypothetical protein EYC84_011520 [Monilinia fructicola]